MKHYSVMLNETIDLLNIKEDGIYVDGTLGRAGHSKEIVKRLKNGRLYCFDKDLDAINESKKILKDYLDKVTFIHDSFENIGKYIKEIDGFLLDLGVSSPQFDDGERGFSYRFNARLDMRMDKTQELDAYKVINEYSFNSLVNILYKYGEEKNAKLIARGIEKSRLNKPIETTFELVDVIKKFLPMKVLNKKGHPAKQTFQAIRIEVNNEIEVLEKSIEDACKLLNINGRGVVITFHSLEDRIVKTLFNKLSTVEKIDKRIPLLPNEIESADYILLNKKPIVASEKELEENNRSHSAKLRGLERIN
ncbi:MAG: 16S rRNA (cytosine(1402)-N(4))-methyltransferase RsmH [Erysipelotrichaceae bacterium]|nr:16S rRNA (cytosine(1402)-N(4))-methyltransferase RsmH [Erysipelotrichaceae bacterium]